MKVLFDQNLSPRLAMALQPLLPGSAHVRDFQLQEAEDWEVWNHAAIYGFAIATKDTDFLHRSYIQGHPPKVIYIAVGNCTTARVEQLFRSYLAELTAFAADPNAALYELL
jgi:predicted nuclease of predicted toxin-antitoxin system